jgi:hypothetical protein
MALVYTITTCLRCGRASAPTYPEDGAVQVALVAHREGARARAQASGRAEGRDRDRSSARRARSPARRHAEGRRAPEAAGDPLVLDREGTRQAYPCDTYGWWEDNLHAIAVVLEDLRRAERYGVQSALLRAGFKALPSQTAPTMDTELASRIIGGYSEFVPFDIRNDAAKAKEGVRAALFRTHPDRNNGDRSSYDNVDAARKVLSSHHGVSL